MRSVQGKWAALSALPILMQPTTALVMRQDHKLPDMQLPDCKTGFTWDSVQDMGQFWFDSGAEKFADAYIQQNGDHSNWVQRLYLDLFPDTDQTEMSCVTYGSICDLEKTCEDFNAIGKGGLYYLFVSMKNFHSFMAELGDRFARASFLTFTDVDTIKSDLKIENTEAGEPFDLKGILGGVLSIGSAVAVANPAAAGGLAAMSGLVAMLPLELPGEPAQNNGDLAEISMNQDIGDMMRHTLYTIDMILAAVFGEQGHHQEDIPQNMRSGAAQNIAVQVFGWGRWLVDHPNIDLDVWFRDTTKRMKQGLLWKMARLYKGTYVIIRDDMNKEACTGVNNGWDEEKQRCLDLLIWNQKDQGDSHRYFGGANDFNGLFEKYEMTPFDTMRNTVDCWEAHGANMASMQVAGTDLSKADSSLPQCFFAMEVKKGSWNQDRHGYLTLDKDYVGQWEGEWPA